MGCRSVTAVAAAIKSCLGLDLERRAPRLYSQIERVRRETRQKYKQQAYDFSARVVVKVN